MSERVETAVFGPWAVWGGLDDALAWRLGLLDRRPGHVCVEAAVVGLRAVWGGLDDALAWRLGLLDRRMAVSASDGSGLREPLRVGERGLIAR